MTTNSPQKLARAFFQLSLLFLPLFVISNISLADGVRYYDFEIIIFESNDTTARLSEVWQTTPELETPEIFIHLNSPYPGPMPREYSPKLTFKRLPKSSYRLKTEAKLLTTNDKNKILLHTSWRQPGMSVEAALPIHFKREFVTTTTAPTAQRNTDPDAPISDFAVITPEFEPQQSESRLDGYIKIILSRYLHANFNLTYTTGLPVATTTQISSIAPDQEDDLVATAAPAPIIYQMNQTRKMRSKEVHYLDHPVLGVIILATPYKGKTLKPR